MRNRRNIYRNKDDHKPKREKNSELGGSPKQDEQTVGKGLKVVVTVVVIVRVVAHVPKHLQPKTFVIYLYYKLTAGTR